MTLRDAEPGVDHLIRSVDTQDEELNAFLSSLGCCPGETITLVSRKKHSCVVAIKDGRYSMDHALASAIQV